MAYNLAELCTLPRPLYTSSAVNYVKTVDAFVLQEDGTMKKVYMELCHADEVLSRGN